MKQNDSTIRILPNPTHSVGVRLARSRDEMTKALELVYACYVQEGLILPNPFGMRVLPQHAVSTTEVLVATRGDEVVSTVSIIRENAFGLPLESIYASHVAQRRRLGVQLAEVSCLAERHATTARPLLMKLMACVAQVSRERGVDQLLIAVHPKHASFYQRILGFDVFGEVKRYGSVLGKPAVGLVLDLNNLQQRSPKAYQRLFGTPYLNDRLAYRPLSRGTQNYFYLAAVTASSAAEGASHERTIVA